MYHLHSLEQCFDCYSDIIVTFSSHTSHSALLAICGSYFRSKKLLSKHGFHVHESLPSELQWTSAQFFQCKQVSLSDMHFIKGQGLMLFWRKHMSFMIQVNNSIHQGSRKIHSKQTDVINSITCICIHNSTQSIFFVPVVSSKNRYPVIHLTDLSFGLPSS